MSNEVTKGRPRSFKVPDLSLYSTYGSGSDLIVEFFRAEIKPVGVRSRSRPFLLGVGSRTSDVRSRPKMRRLRNTAVNPLQYRAGG